MVPFLEEAEVVSPDVADPLEVKSDDPAALLLESGISVKVVLLGDLVLTILFRTCVMATGDTLCFRRSRRIL